LARCEGNDERPRGFPQAALLAQTKASFDLSMLGDPGVLAHEMQPFRLIWN
jgi:hypothetical protein